MDDSVMGTTVLVSSSAAGMLELEGPLHQQQQISHQNHHLQAMGALTVGHHALTSLESEQSMDLSEYKGITKISAIYNKGKPTTSEEDEPSFTEDGTDSHLSGGQSKKNSPWQRMKWTDAMARLLITVVLYVGEDGGLDCTNGNKRKYGMLHKKGKRKSVSRVMMDKGVSVSPQQCEDKFNDLNKRYKRLNDILGRGTTCKVVENPSLLDNMSQLSAKTKDDVRKLLSSKQLLYREMCAYHNDSQMHFSLELDSQACMQSSMIVKNREGHELCGLMKEENEVGEEYDEENEDDIDEDDVEDGDENGGDADVEGIEVFGKRRTSKSSEEVNYWIHRISTYCAKPSALNNLNAEMMEMLQNTTKTPWEKRKWVKSHTLQLQEQKLSLQAQTFELQKRRFKWQKLYSKKDRELERLKLENESMKLENERMALQAKQKELEIEFKKSEASMTSVALLLDRFQGRDQDELGRRRCLQ